MKLDVEEKHYGGGAGVGEEKDGKYRKLNNVFDLISEQSA